MMSTGTCSGRVHLTSASSRIYHSILNSTFDFIALLTILFYFFYLYLCLSSCVVLHILHCPLSRPDLTYISLLIILCIIEYETNKKTLNLD